MNENLITVEYLGIIEERNALLLIDSENRIIDVLKTDKEILFNGNTLQFKNIRVQFNLSLKTVKSNEQKYFQIELVLNLEQNNIQIIEEYNELLKRIRTILYTLTNGKLETLIDDSAFLYSLKSYPLIYEIENLMRNLVMKFLLNNFGVRWIEQKIFKEDIGKISQRKNSNITTPKELLDSFDFITYANSLFKAYSDGDDNTIQKDLFEAKSIEDLENLKKNYIKRNLWDRIIKTENDPTNLSENVKNKWNRLYELRNHIAHNRLISKEIYAEIESLVTFLKPILKDKIGELNNVSENVGTIEIDDLENAEASISARPRTFNFLVNKNILKAGDIITLKNELPEYLTFDESDNKFLAKVTGKLGRSNLVEWLYDNHEYSISGLTWHIFTEFHPDGGNPGGLNGNYHWMKDNKTLLELFDENY
jgi:hypothetical protein